jgi:hypothetical protein
MAKSDYEVQMDELEKEKDAALESVDKNYSDQIAQSDSFYNSQIDAVRDYKEKQSAIQQEQTDFTIGQLQQQKEQTQKDYQKEQSAAYVDFKKQTDPHGVNAEQIAAGGMWGSGYSESAQTAMHNEYQNRVATAKAALDQAVSNYNIAMAQAQAQNSSVLAEIAYNAFVKETELAMQAFTSRNALLEAQVSARAQVESNYMTAAQRLQENRYNVKPSMNDAFTKWVTYLQNEYSNGYVSDAQLWKELVDTYGETALKQAGFSNTGPTVGGNEEGATGTSIEKQLIKIGMAGLSPEETVQRVMSGEIIMTQHADGTYTLEKAEEKSSLNAGKAGSALKTDGVDLSNVSKPAASTAFVPNVAPGSDPVQAGGQVLGQWIANLLGF